MSLTQEHRTPVLEVFLSKQHMLHRYAIFSHMIHAYKGHPQDMLISDEMPFTGTRLCCLIKNYRKKLYLYSDQVLIEVIAFSKPIDSAFSMYKYLKNAHNIYMSL